MPLLSVLKTYFILDAWNRAVKIGKSKNPEKRLKQLQTGHTRELKLIGVLEGDYEKRFHRQWAHYLIRGEWFKAKDDLLLFIYSQTRAPKPKAEKSQQQMTGRMNYERHRAIMRNAYFKYQSKAFSVGMKPEALLPPFGLLPNSSVVAIVEHHQHLNLARKSYQGNLDSFKTKAVLDMNRHKEGVS